MSSSQPLTGTVSAKGHVILPEEVRTLLGWKGETCVVVEITREGLLLKPAPVFDETSPEHVFGSLGHCGATRSVEDMDAGVLAEAERRHVVD